MDTGESPDQQVYVIGIAESESLDPALLRQGRLGLHVGLSGLGAGEIREIWAGLGRICAPGLLAS